MECPNCNGTGRVGISGFDQVCQECGGTGWLDDEQVDELLRSFGYDPDRVATDIRAFVNGCIERYRHLWQGEEGSYGN